MNNIEKFGEDWTIKKLDILFKYLNFYTQALKHTRFKKIYVDGFAREGNIELNNGKIIKGSAAMALNIDIPFDKYIFIEINKDKVAKLSDLANSFAENDIEVVRGDANKYPRKVCEKTNEHSILLMLSTMDEFNR